MNTAPEDPAHGGPDLPPLSDDRVDEIESSLFAAIGRERTTRRTRRTRVWVISAAAAVVVVVAAAIAPTVSTLVSGGAARSGAPESAVGSAPSSPGGALAPGTDLNSTGGAASDSNGGAVKGSGAADSASVAPGANSAQREVITTASATVVVDDVKAAARKISDTAAEHDGYVESLSIGSSGQPIPVDPNSGAVKETTPVLQGAWVTIRVPSDQLDAVVRELSGLGDVTASSVNRQDVTEQTVDLRARVTAEQASVDRLTALMAQAQSVADLVAVEAALAERQANLESYQQQLEYLDGQVAMSSLTVTLVPSSEPVKANPAGFSDGLAAGWNGLVATLNGIVVAFGFLIPWIVVVGLVALVVWWIVRLVRRRRTRRRTASASVSGGTSPSDAVAQPDAATTSDAAAPAKSSQP